MPKNIPKKPDLLIVSDTPMWKTEQGNLALEPVVREIENFYPIFNRITWIGFRHSNADIQNGAVKIEKASVNFVFLPNIGGSGILEKIKILFRVPGYFLVVLSQIKKHHVIHSRGPSIPALFSLIISFFYKKPIFWYKYAGNWDHPKPPLSYRVQREILKKAKNTIGTINGKWKNQAEHLLTFENPTFTEKELSVAKNIAMQKSFEGKLTLVFVGRIEVLKGFDLLLQALSKFGPEDDLEHVYFVGGGARKAYFEEMAKDLLSISYEFTGALKRDALNEIYAKAHIFCLPSLSEGFPKVLAESAAFGCVPIVSDLSCIGQYIMHNKNGILLQNINAEEIELSLSMLIKNKGKLKEMSDQVNKITEKFTYEYYNNRISKDLLKLT
ncbi:glycosyltransferase family 4 protein [Fulvivirgaceae bacterium BMA10]|uniref:Glycosyltransferase family 4 protein n=1 Tax=Splendidivirga corallicola TaxID=3051826 RepID=A0ABT8KZP0_9BACT|nr:glycosyltransferase family 4 protein [Fulvivirgaceae bacterium BMA10]